MKNNYRLSILMSLLLLAVSVQQSSAFYNPQTGRWLSRDPIAERGGRAMYAFIINNPVRGIDFLGLWTLYPPDPAINTVICDGKGDLKVQIGTDNDKNTSSCRLDCTTAHEQSHIDDIKATSPDICKGQPEGQVVGATGDELKATEKKAYTADIDCIQRWIDKRKKGECTCGLIDLIQRKKELWEERKKYE